MSHDIKLASIDLNDQIAKVINNNKQIHDKLVKEFGDDIIDPNKKGLNQAFLKETILPRDPLRKKLTRILDFPLTKQLLKEVYELTKNSRSPIIMDAPLLFDFKFLPFTSYPNLAIMTTEPTLPVKRIAERDDISISEAAKKVCTTQTQLVNLRKKADIIINNDQDVTSLKHQLVKDIAPFLM